MDGQMAGAWLMMNKYYVEAKKYKATGRLLNGFIIKLKQVLENPNLYVIFLCIESIWRTQIIFFLTTSVIRWQNPDPRY